LSNKSCAADCVSCFRFCSLQRLHTSAHRCDDASSVDNAKKKTEKGRGAVQSVDEGRAEAAFVKEPSDSASVQVDPNPAPAAAAASGAPAPVALVKVGDGQYRRLFSEQWSSMDVTAFLLSLKHDEVFGADLKGQPLSKCRVFVVRAVARKVPTPEEEQAAVEMEGVDTLDSLLSEPSAGRLFIRVTLPAVTGNGKFSKPTPVKWGEWEWGSC
jgi:hypothetical protein